MILYNDVLYSTFDSVNGISMLGIYLPSLEKQTNLSDECSPALRAVGGGHA